MSLYGEDDYFGRWIQGICAVPLIVFVIYDLSTLFTSAGFGVYDGIRSAAGTAALYLACRFVLYALTGKNNINRDDF